MALADFASPIPPSAGKPKPFSLPRRFVLAIITVLVAFIVGQGYSLYREWQTLRVEMSSLRRSAVIGYLNIAPNLSYARQPADWYHDEGEFTLLWSGWKQGTGHGWFRIKRGEIDQNQLSFPMGRDVIQAIDSPVIERGGGAIWTRIPSDANVVGVKLDGIQAAYPIQVLDKVCVVNDQVGERPVLVTYNPLAQPQHSAHVYDPMASGQRFIMGTSGYIRERKVVLYDRATESLWVDDDSRGTLRAIAGPSRGTELRAITNPSIVAWSDWQSQNPQGRLLVGANRPKIIAKK